MTLVNHNGYITLPDKLHHLCGITQRATDTNSLVMGFDSAP